jgi:hypothetical protein
MANIHTADTLIFPVERFIKATDTMFIVFWTVLYNTACDILFCAVSDNHENKKLKRTIGRFHVLSGICFFLVNTAIILHILRYM